MRKQKPAENLSESKKASVKLTISRKTGFVCLFILIAACIASVYINNKSKDKDTIITYNIVTQSETILSGDYSQTKKSNQTTKTKASASTTKKTTAVKTETITETTPDYTFPADINTVSAEQLMAIDGIGEVTAGKIIEYRNRVGVITNLFQLAEIDGIGEGTVDLLSGYLYVSDSDYCKYPAVETVPITEDDISETTYYSETQTEQTTQEPEPQLRTVNINSADAQEISDCLLIDIELAEKIIELRNQISYFSDFRELLLVDGISQEMLLELRDYIEI